MNDAGKTVLSAMGLGRTLLGAGLLTLVPIPICDGVVPLSLLLLLLCIPTMGLGLCLVLPLFWLVGSVPIWIYQASRGPAGTEVSASPVGVARVVRPVSPRLSLPKGEGNFVSALADYIRLARSAGGNDEAIRDLCFARGATDREFARALVLVAQQEEGR